MKKTLQCFSCKQQFLREEIINHTGPRAKNGHNYCIDCLKKVQARELFSEKVCDIFGLKAPGPRIWKERERLIEKYGYTDQTIVNCLDYLYNVLGNKKLSESLCLVTPSNIEKMLQYKKNQEYKSNKIAEAFIENMNNKVEPQRIHIRENVTEKNEWDVDDYFFND